MTNLEALQAIASGDPDTKLAPEIAAAVTTLQERGLIRICGCSDGDYVEITESGRRALNAIEERKAS